MESFDILRGSFDSGLLSGDSPLQDALFALGSGSAFDSAGEDINSLWGLCFRDKLFTSEDCGELGLCFEEDSTSDGTTADHILLSPDAHVDGGHCSSDSRCISHVNSSLELPQEENNKYLRRLHSSCPSFLDIGLHHQQDGNYDILPGATDIVLLDTDEEDLSAPLETFSGESDSSNTTMALDLKRIISAASLSIPQQDAMHVPMLSIRTSSLTVTASEPIESVAALQSATGFFSPSLEPALCMAVDGDLSASRRPRRATATAFDVNEVVECPLKIGKKRGSGTQAGKLTANPNGHACTACGALTTPVWRAGPHGPKTLCNACGVRYMKVAKRK